MEYSELAAKIQDLHIFFSLLIPDMSHEEKQLLDEALVLTYQQKGITHENESLIDPENPEQYKEMPVLGDVYNELIRRNQETGKYSEPSGAWLRLQFQPADQCGFEEQIYCIRYIRAYRGLVASGNVRGGGLCMV